MSFYKSHEVTRWHCLTGEKWNPSKIHKELWELPKLKEKGKTKMKIRAQLCYRGGEFVSKLEVEVIYSHSSWEIKMTHRWRPSHNTTTGLNAEANGLWEVQPQWVQHCIYLQYKPWFYGSGNIWGRVAEKTISENTKKFVVKQFLLEMTKEITHEKI